MKIGIELNYLIRDINSQMLKYYMKDIDKSFDDSNVETNVTKFIDSLGFKTKKAKETFLYVDYPYEIFGCAKTIDRNSSVMLNGWLEKMDNEGYNGSEVSLFSLKENALTIQSTYYFLSKIGCRVRNMFFPKDGVDMWNKCDVIITTNERIVRNKPDDKKVVLILTKDNSHLSSLSDFVYSSFTDVIEDDTFFKMLEKIQPKQSLFSVIKNKFKKIFRLNE
jgi:hypothetical protein